MYSLFCTAETNTTLQINHTEIRFILKKWRGTYTVIGTPQLLIIWGRKQERLCKQIRVIDSLTFQSLT